MYTAARATLEILIPDFVKQTSEEKPSEGDELEVLFFFLFFKAIRVLHIQWNWRDEAKAQHAEHVTRVLIIGIAKLFSLKVNVFLK